MEYYELTFKVKIPRPRRTWFRFRLRTLLLLMLLIAIGSTFWHHHDTDREQRILQRLAQSKADRATALQQWKRAVAALRAGDNATADEERARSKYFKHRTEVEDLLRQVVTDSN
jgi:hypothetical protein